MTLPTGVVPAAFLASAGEEHSGDLLLSADRAPCDHLRAAAEHRLRVRHRPERPPHSPLVAGASRMLTCSETKFTRQHEDE